MSKRFAVREEWRLRIRYVAVTIRRSLRHFGWAVLAVLPSSTVRQESAPSAHDRSSGDTAERVITYRGRLLVEPKYGWAITRPARLLRDSLTFGEETHHRSGREWIGLPPLGTVARRFHPPHLDQAISIMSPWPENYYHFVTDVLPKLCSLSCAGQLDPSNPILVSQVLYDMPFFQEAKVRGGLAELDFRPVRHRVRLSHLTVTDGRTIDAPTAESMRRMLDVAPLGSREPDAKIFVTRHPDRGRTLQRFDEIRGAWEERGYQTLDLDGLSFTQQVAMFRSASHVAAIHGAALANLVWCDAAQVGVIELVPRISTSDFDCFQDLCEVLGIRYRRVLGVDAGFAHKRASFDVNLEELRSSLEAADEDYFDVC